MPQRPAEPVSAAAGVQCPLGHPNAGSARFCADCGMPMSEVVLTQRVDLEAVRAAMGTQDSAERRAEKDRQHMEAIAANARIEQELPDISQVPDPSERKILIHFVEDGFTWKKVWLRGEMLEIGPDHPWWESAQPWIRLTKVQQFQRYGRVFFDYGPFPGIALRPGTETQLPSASVNLWAEVRGALPARPSADQPGALVPW